MKRYLLIIPITIALAIFFYPITSNSNAAGSVGGKTGSPNDVTNFNINNCTGCHYAGVGTGATITSDIPSSGYVPGNVYTITANINQSGINKFGFEITSEETNFGSAKKGTFFITNSTETQQVNNNTAITHKAGGTTGVNNSKSWSFNWQAPGFASSTGGVIFYGAFIGANGDGDNTGDTYHAATYTINEASTSTNNISSENQIIFNQITKTIESVDNSKLSVYDMKGKLMLSSSMKYTSLSNLSNGIYIIKSEKNSQKILIN